MKRPRQVATADHAIWLATTFLDKLTSEERNGCFPAALARHSGMSRLEAQLALRMCVEIGYAVRRNDGRFFKETKPQQIVTVALAPSLTVQSSDEWKGNKS